MFTFNMKRRFFFNMEHTVLKCVMHNKYDTGISISVHRSQVHPLNYNVVKNYEVNKRDPTITYFLKLSKLFYFTYHSH